MKNIIVAYDKERAIGANGDLLWNKGEMRSDMKRFREITMGHVMIMGRKTLESIGIVLPGRRTIMLSRQDNIEIPGVETAHSLEEAYLLAKGHEEIFVVGGGEIYQQAVEGVDRIYATEIEESFSGADTFFPKLSYKWHEVKREDFSVDDNNIYPYSFVTYERD